MSFIKVLFFSTLVVWVTVINSAFAQTHLESDGVVMLQTESESAQGGWNNESSISDYSGSGYLVWQGMDSFSESTAGRGTITYRFHIQRAGNYQMRWRSRITRGDNHTEHNDSWVRFPSGKNIVGEQALSDWSKVYMSTLNRWVWQSSTVDNVGRPVRQYFSAGAHTLQISGRSSGHAIDRIALYRYADVNFSASEFDSLPDSDQIGGGTIEITPAPVTESMSAPSVSVSGNILSWPAVDANAINVHRGTGEWLESLPATQTQWLAPAPGSYYLVATGNSSWETWGRSDTMTVAVASAAPGGLAPLDLSVQIYSSSALEIFWNSPGKPDIFYEVQRNGERVMFGAQRSFFDDGLQPATRYAYSILVIDSAGNVLQTEQMNATTQGGSQGIDNPGANTVELAGKVYSQTAIELFWNTDGIDALSTTAYRIYLNGRLIGESYGRSLFIDTLSAGTSYEFSVAAIDVHGMEVSSNIVVLSTYAVDTP